MQSARYAKTILLCLYRLLPTRSCRTCSASSCLIRPSWPDATRPGRPNDARAAREAPSPVTARDPNFIPWVTDCNTKATLHAYNMEHTGY